MKKAALCEIIFTRESAGTNKTATFRMTIQFKNDVLYRKLPVCALMFVVLGYLFHDRHLE